MYQLRKCERYTIWQSSEIINLDPEKFRNLSTPYTGNSEKDFLEYFNNLDLDEVYEELDDDTNMEISAIGDDINYTIYSNSAWKFEDSWLEIGKENPEWRKFGGFEATHSTDTETF